EFFRRLEMPDVPDVKQVEDAMTLDHRPSFADLFQFQRQRIDILDLSRNHQLLVLPWNPSGSHDAHVVEIVEPPPDVHHGLRRVAQEPRMEEPILPENAVVPCGWGREYRNERSRLRDRQIAQRRPRVVTDDPYGDPSPQDFPLDDELIVGRPGGCGEFRQGP